jgi:hypothetical protein
VLHQVSLPKRQHCDTVVCCAPIQAMAAQALLCCQQPTLIMGAGCGCWMLIMRPCVPTACRVSALGYYNQVHAMPLTEHTMLAVLPDERRRQSLTSIFVALRRCISRIEQFCRNVQSYVPRPLTVEGRNPLLPWPLYMNYGDVKYADR